MYRFSRTLATGTLFLENATVGSYFVPVRAKFCFQPGGVTVLAKNTAVIKMRFRRTRPRLRILVKRKTNRLPKAAYL